MIEPILTVFFTAILNLLLYNYLPEENQFKSMFLWLTILSIPFLTFAGFQETSGIHPSGVMEIYFAIYVVLIGFLLIVALAGLVLYITFKILSWVSPVNAEIWKKRLGVGFK